MIPETATPLFSPVFGGSDLACQIDSFAAVNWTQPPSGRERVKQKVERKQEKSPARKGNSEQETNGKKKPAGSMGTELAN